jgi:hypothetical protein
MPLFVSVHIDDDDRLIVGSIYYDWGRYRLRHRSGPKKSVRPPNSGITPYAVNRTDDTDRHLVDQAFLDQGPTIGPLYVDRTFIETYRLIEYRNGEVYHPSRGAPVPMIRLTSQSQADVNRWADLVEANLPNPTNAIFGDEVLEIHLQ